MDQPNSEPALSYTIKQQKKAIEAVKNTSLDFNKTCLLILTLLAIFYTLYFAASIVLPFVLAIVLNLLLAPPIRFLHNKLRIPKPLAAIALILIMIAAVGGIGTAISLPASGWISRIPDSFPALQAKLSILHGPVQALQKAFAHIQTILEHNSVQGETTAAHSAVIASGGSESNLFSIGSVVLISTREWLVQIFTTVILLFFFLAKGDSLLRRLVEIMPTASDKRRLVQIALEIEKNVSTYLVTITFMNILVGIANMAQCWLLGMPNPLLWGVVAFLLNYIPIIGPMTGIVIYFFVGLFSYPSLLEAFFPPFVYLVIHLMEGETITPILLAKRFTLNPVMVMASLMFWDWLWGISGAFLSLPMLAVLKILCDHIDALTPIGHILGGPAKPNSLRSLVKDN